MLAGMYMPTCMQVPKENSSLELEFLQRCWEPRPSANAASTEPSLTSASFLRRGLSLELKLAVAAAASLAGQQVP